jgi:DNA-binding transcriptional regulator YhcF (GntR family)
MNFDFVSDTPLFLQIAEQIEDGILGGIFAEEEQIPSTTEISVSYKINPATVLKGMNILAEEELLYKKRGIGMFVATDAKQKIKAKRQKAFFDTYVAALLDEAQRLGISQEQLFAMIDGRTTNA